MFAEGTFTINAPADKVWATVSGFDKVEEYIPIMKSSVLEGKGVGAVRTIKSIMQDGSINTIKERLELVDESRQLLKFRVLETSLTSFQNAVITQKVTSLQNNQTEFYTSCLLDRKGIDAEEFRKMCLSVFKVEAEGLEKLHHN